MTCSFDDEFTSSLDASKWTAQTTAVSGYTTGPTGQQACYEPGNVTVADGLLSLTASRTATFTCKKAKSTFTTSLTSGMVSSVGKFSQTYGRFEIRAKLPDTGAAGLQETLWLWPASDIAYGPAWPESGEIDFAEFYSKYPSLVIPYLHYLARSIQPVTNYCQIKRGQFNVYGLTWRPSFLSIDVNGRTCLVDNYRAANAPSPAPFDKPFFIALTQAIGSNGGNAITAATPLPATTQIDYVRVWR
jgi:beta-glucanase (GH16 family)